jgi:hypothetical protein
MFEIMQTAAEPDFVVRMFAESLLQWCPIPAGGPPPVVGVLAAAVFAGGVRTDHLKSLM